MTIDLRYILPLIAFYVPGLLILIGAWALGYTTEEARDAVAVMGGISGAMALIFCAAFLFSERKPIRVRLWKTGDDI